MWIKNFFMISSKTGLSETSKRPTIWGITSIRPSEGIRSHSYIMHVTTPSTSCSVNIMFMILRQSSKKYWWFLTPHLTEPIKHFKACRTWISFKSFQSLVSLISSLESCSRESLSFWFLVVLRLVRSNYSISLELDSRVLIFLSEGLVVIGLGCFFLRLSSWIYRIRLCMRPR